MSISKEEKKQKSVEGKPHLKHPNWLVAGRTPKAWRTSSRPPRAAGRICARLPLAADENLLAAGPRTGLAGAKAGRVAGPPAKKTQTLCLC